jgi:transcriptional regulator with XRE-family HTH domain
MVLFRTMPKLDAPASPGPIAARIILGSKLRQLREASGLTPQQAAKAIRGSDSKISRIELGRHAAKEIDVVDLLNCYGIANRAQREQLLALASLATAPPWWQPFAEILPTWFSVYVGLEEGAEFVACYDTHFFPGLLQTEDYAAWLALLRDPDPVAAADPVIAAGLREMRAERVTRFTAGGGQLCCVIDEAVLRRSARDPQMRRAQLTHLLEAASRPGVTVRIRTLAAGPPITPVGFSLLRFADPLLPDVVYTEQLTSASYFDRPADVSRYAEKMKQLLNSSTPAQGTAAIIERILTEFS